MLKQFKIGASFALAAAVIVGCSSKKGNSFAVTPTGELSNTDSFPASSIAQNNVAQDGAAFSDNNLDANTATAGVGVKCTFNNKVSNSDSPNSAADGSAMVFFVLRDNANNVERVFCSYWSGSAFTAPQEITGVDRNESIVSGQSNGVHVASVILCPLNTSAYTSPGSTTATGASDQLVRANSGNWLILWDAQTFTQHPALQTQTGAAVNASSDIAAADQNGAHHTVYANMFLKTLANQPVATTNLIGNTATSGTANGPAVECRSGFQVVGREVPTNRGGASQRLHNNAVDGGLQINASNNVGLFPPTQAGFRYRPAEDVISYAISSDTLVHCATFTAAQHGPNGASGLGFDPTGLTNTTNANTRIGEINGFFITGATSAASGGSQVVAGIPSGTLNTNAGAVPSTSSYQVGDNTSFIQLFYTQLVTSHAGASTGTFQTASNFGQVQIGPHYRNFTANFNLASMTFGTPAVVPFPTSRSNGGAAFNAATQPLPGWVTYNNTVFYRYADASLTTTIAGGAGNFVGSGFEAGLVDTSNRRTNVTVAMACLTVTPAANGVANINATAQFDVTLLGTAGKHPTANRTVSTSVAGSDPGDETVSFLDCTGNCAVYGADEGLQDVTAFVFGRSTTNTTASASDADQQLWVTAVNPSTGAAVSGGAGTNPRRISKHQVETQVTGTLPALTNANNRDDAFDAKVQMNRDGTYILVAYRQAQATSLNSNLGLMATVYKTSRAPVASVGSAIVTAPTTLDQRLPTTDPVQVNVPADTAYAQAANATSPTGTTAGFSGSPVAAYDIQGQIGYRCGFQSDKNKMSLLWLTADNTEDRAFIRQITVTLGATAATNPTFVQGTVAEIDATASGNLVPGGGRGTQDTFITNGPQKISGSQYRFLPASHGQTIPTTTGVAVNGQVCSTLANTGIGSADGFLTVDAGSSGTAGDVLIVFSKVTDATTSDGNFFNRGIFASRFVNAGTITERVALGNNVVENVASAYSGGNPSTLTFSAFRTGLARLLPTPTSSSLSATGTGTTAATAGSLSATNGTYIYFNSPFNDNGSSPSGLFARHFKATSTATGATATTFPNLFFPVASAKTTDTTFKAPTRLSRDLNANATFTDVFRKGQQAIVLMTQDNHLWGSTTKDGDTYSNKNGLPDPALFDNNLSIQSPNLGIASGYGTCRKQDTNCDDTSGTIVFFVKQDLNQNNRIYIRVMQ